jgi:integrase
MYQAIVTLAYYTGSRINSELLTLEWHQIDRQACVIRLEPGSTKNKRGRTFTYAEILEVKAAVDGLWARHEALAQAGTLTPVVFCRRKGQAIKTFCKR